MAHALQEAGWRDHDPCGPRDGLEDDRGEGGRTFEEDGVLEALEGPGALFLLGAGVKDRAVEEGTEEVHDPGRADVVGPAPRVPGQVDRGRGGPVVAAVSGEDLLSTGVQAGHAHRVFDGLGAAVGEEDLGRPLEGVVQDEFGRPIALLVAVLGRDRAERAGLVLDSANDGRVLVADIGVDQLRGEVEVGLAGLVGHVDAVGIPYHQGVYGRLR
jgi:hypothetical protein